MTGTDEKSRRLLDGTVMAGIAVRLVAAAVLLFGPWTDEPNELSEWDIERFTIIATEDGRPWRDHLVEYPPGSVIVFESLIAPDKAPEHRNLGHTVVDAHRRLVLLALGADLGLAWLLGRRNRRLGAVYLALGLPLVPMGLLRLDIIVALLATAGAVASLGSVKDPVVSSAEQPSFRQTPQPSALRGAVVAASAAVLTAAAALTKVWPGLLIPAYWALRRDRAALASIVATATGGAAWLFWAGAGLDPVRQVIELRGATGWHVESTGGVITTLTNRIGMVPTANEPSVVFELNAFRIGTLSPLLVTVGRVVTIVVAVALAWRVRALPLPPPSASGQSELFARLGAFLLGATSLLLATAPLLSPQFILWLTPWAALMAAAESTDRPMGLSTPVLITAAAAVITGITLALFGPPRMGETVPALAMAVRNGLLVYLPIGCWRWLGHRDRRPVD